MLLTAGLLLTGCASVHLKEKTYESGGSAFINGAEVRSAVKPMGGEAGLQVSAMVYNTATGTSDGPFLWRIEATGEEGVHESLAVHQLRVKTSKTGRDEPFPSKWLGESQSFLPMKGKENAGKVFASYQLPGKLEVFPETDGEITIEAVVEVIAGGKSERKMVRFTMSPKVGRENDFFFLPTEIVRSFGKKDPTEWKWNSAGSTRYSDDLLMPDGYYGYY